MAKAKMVPFKPARRVFAGRGRPMLTFGEWRIAFTAMLFGAGVSALWFYERPLALLAALEQPPAAAVDLSAPTPAEATAPTTAAFEPEAVRASGDQHLPQIVLAEEDGRESRTPPPTDYSGRAARVVDGDTFYLEGVPSRIRLWGVDAPEQGEAGFDEATAALAGLVADQMLDCEHVDTDRYHRIVARCTLADGRDLSEAMIKSGAAEEYLRFTGGYYGGE